MGFDITGTPTKVKKENVSANMDDVLPNTGEKVSKQKIEAMAKPADDEETDGDTAE